MGSPHDRLPAAPRYTVTLSPEACAYCRDVAREVERLGPGEQPTRWFHGGCRCTVAPSWRVGDTPSPPHEPVTAANVAARTEALESRLGVKFEKDSPDAVAWSA